MIYLVSNQLNAFDGVFQQISLDKALKLLDDLLYIGLDTETEGLDCFTKKLLTIQLGNKDIQVVVDISSFGYVPENLKKFLMRTDKVFILQNAKFDLKFLYHHRILIGKVYDTMLAEIILTNGLQYDGRDLATLVQKYCGQELDKSVRGDIITKGLSAAVIRYAAYDVVYLEDIMRKQMYQARHLKVVNAITLDNSFVKVLAYIEYCGIKLDWKKWQEKAQKDLEELRRCKAILDEWLWNHGYTQYFDGMHDLFSGDQGCTLNWNSSQQVIPFFESLGINCTINKKGEKKKTCDAKHLSSQKNDFAILPLYLKYKEQEKLCSTYGLKWARFINPVTGRIHTTFKQLMDTGRLSSGSKTDGTPNLQNLPADDLTRSCFIAENGNKYIAVDYSAQESILMANMSSDRNLLDFYRRGFEDIHSYVTFLLFPEIRRMSLEDLTNDELKYIKKAHKHERNVAKTAEFAISYGGNGSTIARNTGSTKAQGEFVYNSYFDAFCDLKTYFDNGMKQVERDCYINYNNITGRKYFFKPDAPFIEFKDLMGDPSFRNHPDYREISKLYNESRSEAQRLSQNYRIQGTAADMSKWAGILFMQEIINRGWLWTVKIVNMVHDEFNVECPEHMADEVAQCLVDCMEKAGERFCTIIPIKADPSIGDHWIH